MIEIDSLNIANLPHDIIRRIIRNKPFGVKCMRQISKFWNLLVLEFISERNRFPPIEQCLFWPLSTTAKKEDDLTVIIRIKKHHWPAFLNRLTLSVPKVSVRSNEGVMFHSLIIRTEDTSTDNNCLYKYLQILFLLASRIKWMEMNQLSEGLIERIEKSIPILVAVNTVAIDVVNFSEQFQNFTLKMARSREFWHIHITAQAWDFKTWKIRDYLLQFVKISFTIHLGERGDIAQRDLLFGESKERCDAISEELIDSGMMSVEMFNARGLISQKLSHLYK